MSRETQPPRHLRVTCAIIEADGRVLAAQRGPTMSMAHKWEFPGGKIHDQESAEDCLRRELLEELGLEVDILRALEPSPHRYPDFAITLYPFVCRIKAGALVVHEHQAVTWLPPAELAGLDWAEADLPVLASYLAGVL